MIHAWQYPSSGDGSLPLPVPHDIPEPTLADDQVLIAVEGSVFGAPERIPVPGVTPGGAAVGTVTATGQGATHLLGRRVVVGPDAGCGECDVCRRAGVVVCPRSTTLGRTVDGTLASAVVARARWVCALEGELVIPGPAAALVGREAAWAYALFVRAGVAPGEPVVVFGGDIVARFLVQIAVAKGTRPMVAVRGQAPGWEAWTREHGGVPVACNAGDTGDAATAGKALHEAAVAGGHGERPWHVFETSATTESRRLALSVTGPGARVTMLARRAVGAPTPGEPLALDAVETVLDGDASILGVAGAHPDLLPEVAALVVRGELDVASAARVVTPDALAAAVAQQDEDDPPRVIVMTPAADTTPKE